MSCSYWEKEDIIYQRMWGKIWNVKLGVVGLDESKMRAEIIELFKEK